MNYIKYKQKQIVETEDRIINCFFLFVFGTSVFIFKTKIYKRKTPIVSVDRKLITKNNKIILTKDVRQNILKTTNHSKDKKNKTK